LDFMTKIPPIPRTGALADDFMRPNSDAWQVISAFHGLGEARRGVGKAWRRGFAWCLTRPGAR
jgi:hypothetical protein